MSRSIAPEIATAGHDSFLDIVTNMVGILIVLVLVVGLRIKNAPAKTALTPDLVRAATELQRGQGAELALRQSVAEATLQIQTLKREAFLRDQERQLLANAAATVEQSLGERRQQLDDRTKVQFDLGRQIAEAQATLAGVKRELTGVQTSAPPAVVIENTPTPIAKTVVGEEIHFQLRGGRLAWIPLEPLLLAARDSMRAKLDKLVADQGLPEVTETVGPQGGFRLRYSMERYDKVEKTHSGPVRYSGARLTRWTIIPQDSQLGERLDDALAERSRIPPRIGHPPP